MATQGTTGTGQTVSTSEETLFTSENWAGRPPTTICISVRSTSAAPLVVRIPELHGDSGGAYIEAGSKEYFRVNDGGIKTIYALGSGGDATVDWYPVATTRN